MSRTAEYLSHYEEMTNEDLFNWYYTDSYGYNQQEIMYFYLMFYRVIFSLLETETNEDAKKWLIDGLEDLFTYNYFLKDTDSTCNEMVTIAAVAQSTQNKLWVSDKSYYFLFRNILSGETKSDVLDKMVTLVGTVYEKKGEVRPELLNFKNMAQSSDVVTHSDKLSYIDAFLKHSISICEFSPVNLLICKYLDIIDGNSTDTSESIFKSIGKLALTIVTGVFIVLILHALFNAIFKDGD